MTEENPPENVDFSEQMMSLSQGTNWSGLGLSTSFTRPAQPKKGSGERRERRRKHKLRGVWKGLHTYLDALLPQPLPLPRVPRPPPLSHTPKAEPDTRATDISTSARIKMTRKKHLCTNLRTIWLPCLLLAGSRCGLGCLRREAQLPSPLPGVLHD